MASSSSRRVRSAVAAGSYERQAGLLAPRARGGGSAAALAPARSVAAVGVTEALLVARRARLEAQRRAMGCSQERLAAALGVSRSSIGRILRGEADGDHLRSSRAATEALHRIELALRLIAASQMAIAARDTVPLRPRGDVPARQDRGPRDPHASAARAAEAAAPAPLAAAPHTFRLLIAEDDAATVDLYRLVFAEEWAVRYAIEVATTVSACVDRLLAAPIAAPYDLLLMDLGLADVRDGGPAGSLLARLVGMPDRLPPRVLVVSGISPYHLQAKRSELAAIHASFLAKPFDVDELLRTVRALCLAERLPPGGAARHGADRHAAAR